MNYNQTLNKNNNEQPSFKFWFWVFVIVSLMASISLFSCDNSYLRKEGDEQRIYINPDNQRKYEFHLTKGELITVEQARRKIDYMENVIDELNKELKECKK